MDYATWEKHKVELQNESWTPFGKWPTDVQDAMREVEVTARMVLSSYGEWQKTHDAALLSGNVYRVNQAWPGPAKPKPVVEYEDWTVVEKYGFFGVEDKTAEMFRALYIMACNTSFAGYVMPDGKLRPRLIFDAQNDGTYRLRVPKAVRLRKEAVR